MEPTSPGGRKLTSREAMVNHYMKKRRNEYTTVQPFRVFCGTWNVNGQPPSECLYDWLSSDPDPPDIYAIGFQELDLSKEAFIFSESSREQDWYELVRKNLHSKATYRKLSLIRLVGVMLIVLVKEEHYSSIKYVDSEHVATGILGLLGNKGGVGVRLSLNSTSLCFINTHLAAHQDEVDRRNQDYRDIENKMKFRQFLPPMSIDEHDVIFWIGDLNYRLHELDAAQVKQLIQHQLYEKLLPSDQLNQLRGKTDVFKGYKEGEINFCPTYKYDTGTDVFDTSEKARTPAWCDRILWKGDGIRQMTYRSHPSQRLSDHKPVSSLFEVAVKIQDEKKSKKVYEDIMKQLDRMENDFLPQVKLDKMDFFYDNVQFIEPQTKILTVINVGQRPVEFEFIKKNDEDSICKPWLNVDPCKNVLVPGDSCEVHLEIYIDKVAAQHLNRGEDKIEDILVLHLQGGKDFFITIGGEYVPSCFGSSIEALIQTCGPLREVPVAQLLDIQQRGSMYRKEVMIKEKVFPIPRELWRLVDHLYKYGRQHSSIFQQPGLHAEIQQIRDALDTGKPDLLPGSIHSMAEALLLFIQAFPEPVIPYSMYDRCLQCCNNFLLCKQVLAQIPVCHRNVFKYICAFLREMLMNSEENNLDYRVLADIFSELFLRAPKPVETVHFNVGVDSRARIREKKAAFIYHFLTNEYDE